jgi:hypothetical protein
LLFAIKLARSLASIVVEIVVHIVGKVFELGKVSSELHTNFAYGPVTLLTNNDFGHTQVFGVFVINLIAIDK